MLLWLAMFPAGARLRGGTLVVEGEINRGAFGTVLACHGRDGPQDPRGWRAVKIFEDAAAWQAERAVAQRAPVGCVRYFGGGVEYDQRGRRGFALSYELLGGSCADLLQMRTGGLASTMVLEARGRRGWAALPRRSKG